MDPLARWPASPRGLALAAAVPRFLLAAESKMLMVISAMAKHNIPQPVFHELNRQFNQELASAHLYLALSHWCDIRNLKGFGKYFVKQAGEERAHAERLLKHLTDGGANRGAGAQAGFWHVAGGGPANPDAGTRQHDRD
jgi:hypothetical protein